MPDMLAAACDLMFRIAIAAGQGIGDATSATLPHTIGATDTRSIRVLTTDYSYLAGAVALSLVTLLLALVLYPHNRDTTLPPVEMAAKACDTALSASTDSKTTTDALAESAGQQKAKDGATNIRDSTSSRHESALLPTISDDDEGYSLIEREEITPSSTPPRQADTPVHDTAAALDNIGLDGETALRFRRHGTDPDASKRMEFDG